MISYDSMAWEKKSGAFGGGSFDEPYRKNLVKWLMNSGAGRIIDAGCLDGHYIRRLRQLGYTGEYVGLDVTPSFIARAKMLSPGENFMVADVRERFPLCGDTAMLANVLMHLDRPKDALEHLCEAASREVLISTYSSEAGAIEVDDGFLNRWYKRDEVVGMMPLGWRLVEQDCFRPAWVTSRGVDRAILQLRFVRE